MVEKIKKENVKKTAVKKKATKVSSLNKKNVVVKEEVNVIENPFTVDMFFTFYFKGWMDSFKLKGRTSRFELWIFMLVNALIMAFIQLKCCYMFSDKYLVDANALGLSINQIEYRIFWAEVAFYLSFFIPLVPIASMMIRRMHDIGKLAWNGYLEPVVKGFVVLSLLSYVDNMIDDIDYSGITLTLNVCYVTILYSIGYYSLKFLFSVMFYDGDKNDNEYGKAQYKEDCYLVYALKFSVFYFLFIGTMILFYIGLYSL